jgi:trans-aconitate methyltransferase
VPQSSHLVLESDHRRPPVSAAALAGLDRDVVEPGISCADPGASSHPAYSSSRSGLSAITGESVNTPAVRIYGDLAPWFHLLTAPEDYAEEASRYRSLIHEEVPDARTLLELGSGGGNNASHLKEHFTCTLSDLSPQMLTLSRTHNPDCQHVLGDMRTLRLGRTFDAVFVHDAVMYLTTEDDLRACMETALSHTRPGGVALFAPDCTRETFEAGTDHGGHDGDDGRALRYLEWTHAPDPGAATFAVDYVVLLSEPGAEARVVHDRHVNGLFPEHTWLYLLEGAGFTARLVPGGPADEYAEQPVFVARRPS